MVECGLTPEQFWESSWYELDLLSKQHRLRRDHEWNHTRHIMAALTGEKPSSIIELSFDTAAASLVENPEETKRRILISRGYDPDTLKPIAK